MRGQPLVFDNNLSSIRIIWRMGVSDPVVDWHWGVRVGDLEPKENSHYQGRIESVPYLYASKNP